MHGRSATYAIAEAPAQGSGRSPTGAGQPVAQAAAITAPREVGSARPPLPVDRSVG
jgi:hypothetical protein